MIRDQDLVFNVIWTGSVFRYLRYFVCSLLAHSEARFRFVVNGVPPDACELIEEFADAHRDRVVEVLDVSPSGMLPHGKALDAVYRVRDDGGFFCFVDADIKARQPFLAEFRELLNEHAVVTSGRTVWTDDHVRPADRPGVSGRHFFDQDGFVFGSSHLAIYHRGPLDETMARWGVGLGSPGPNLLDETRERLDTLGRGYVMFDTAKIVNILLQGDGHSLCHFDHPELVHIGGVSHYLAPRQGPRGEDEEEPNWAQLEEMAPRFEVTRFTASVLRDLSEGRRAPQVPAGLESDMEERLRIVSEELTDLVESYRSC